MIRRQITANGILTNVIDTTTTGLATTLLFIVPGNPGIAEYYYTFANSLNTLLNNNTSSYAISMCSHAGHSPASSLYYGLSQQTSHKLSVLTQHYRQYTDIILIGHSMGCYIILQLLDSIMVHYQLVKCYLLFPTIERMRDSPRGVTYVSNTGRLLCTLMKLCLRVCSYTLPYAVIRCVLECVFRSIDKPDRAPLITATIEAMHAITNILLLSDEEMLAIFHRDNATLSKHMSSIVLYYGSTDHWCPVAYFRDMLRDYPEHPHSIHLCETGVPHAFVLGSAGAIATWVYGQIMLT